MTSATRKERNASSSVAFILVTSIEPVPIDPAVVISHRPISSSSSAHSTSSSSSMARSSAASLLTLSSSSSSSKEARRESSADLVPCATDADIMLIFRSAADATNELTPTVPMSGTMMR